MNSMYRFVISAFALLFLVSGCATTHGTKRVSSQVASSSTAVNPSTKSLVRQTGQELLDPPVAVRQSAVCNNSVTFRSEEDDSTHIACGWVAEKIRPIVKKQPNRRLQIHLFKNKVEKQYTTFPTLDPKSIPSVKKSSLTDSPWFWTVVGVVATGAVTTAIVCGSGYCNRNANTAVNASSGTTFPTHGIINFPSGP